MRGGAKIKEENDRKKRKKEIRCQSSIMSSTIIYAI
jgi:hypothetical protein